MKRFGLAMVACCVALGCHNVDLPDIAALSADGGGGVPGSGPSLRIGNLAGTKLSLDSQISFDAEDVDGVAQVTLSCSGIILFTWTSPPYVAQVNLAPCQNLGTPTADGSGAVNVVLTLTATDLHGNSSHADFTVVIDPSAAALSTDLPERVRPGLPFTFEVVADRALRGVPVVKVGGVQADVQPTDAGSNTFLAHLAQLPLLGVDAYAGAPGTAPASVLEDFDRALDVTVETVSSNGNASSITRTVRLTRILWDEPLPAPEFTAPTTTAQPTSLPTASARGLTIPLDFSLTGNGQRGIQFLPAFYANDGGLTTQSALVDGGFYGRAIDALGNLEVEPFQDVATEIFFVDPESGASTSSPSTYLPNPNVQYEGLLCGGNGGCFGSTATLSCIGADGSTLSTDIGADGGATGMPVVTSKNTVLAELTDCGSFTTWSVVQPKVGTASPIEPTAVYAPDPVSWINCTRQKLDPIPLGDGSFAILDDLFCDNPSLSIVQQDLGVSENFWIGPDGSHLGSYSGNLPLIGFNGRAVMAGIPGGKLLTLSPGTPSSTLQFWPADGGDPDPAEDVVFPGFFQYPPDLSGTPAPPPRDTVRNANGFAVLTATSSFTRAVVQFDSQFRPRWIYRYPRLAQNGTLQLIGSESSPLLFLVDTFNQRVVAIQP